jgi:hypothetical protein
MRALFLAGFAAVSLMSGGAMAQINPFGNAQGNVLSNEDFTILNRAVETLLTQPNLHVGSNESWKNPNTGSTGTITIQSNFTRKPWACHTLGYQAAPNGTPIEGVAVLDWCKTKQGWKIT